MMRLGRGTGIRLLMTVAFACAADAFAREESLQGFAIPDGAPDVEPRVDYGPQAPPPAPFPISPVDQSVLRGARHGFVNTTSGNLTFSILDMRLAGRLPIEIRRVYDSGLAAAMPASPPNPPNEPRWSHDLGANWLLGCGGYLITTTNGVTMVTGDGDVMDWTEGTGGAFSRVVDAPTKHMKLTRQSSTVIVEKQLDGTTWTYTWLVSASGSAYVLTEVADRSGNNLTLTYNQGYLSRIANTDGAYIDLFRPLFDSNYPTVSFPRNRVIRLNDSTGRIVYFDYNASGQLTTATDVRDKAWAYGYTSGRLSAAVTPLSETFLNASYDGAGRVQLYEANQGPWQFAYLSGNVTRVTDALGHSWDYTHASSGITTTVLEPTQGQRVLTLDSANNPATYTGPMGESATWTYDTNHRPVVHKPAGTTATITYAYDATEGWVDSITSLTTGTTTFIRDTHGRVTEERDAYNNKTTATYATNGDRLTLRRPRGNAVTPAAGFQWSFAYDTYGSPATATDPTGRLFEFLYTNRGDFTQMKRPDHLDTMGQPVKSTWTTKRDASGRSTGTITPAGNESYNSYDDAGRLVNVTGPAGSNLRFEYDSRFRLIAIWNDALNIPPPGVNEPVLLAQFTYDAAGNLDTHGTSIMNQTHYEWDASGRLAKITDAVNRSWIYERDLSGRVKKVTWPSGRSVTILRDSAGRVTGRLFPGGREEEFSYDASGQPLTANVDDGTDHSYLTWTRDLVERPLTITTDVSWESIGDSRTLSFAYDPNGNRATVLDSQDAPTTLTYDELDRVTVAAKSQGPTWNVAYDQRSGHRTHVDVMAPGATDPNFEDWTFDPAGRVLNHHWSRPGTADTGNVTFTYGAENRILTQTDSLGGTSSQMTYRADGLLTAQSDTLGGVTTASYFGYDGDRRVISIGITKGTSPMVETLLQYDGAGRIRTARRGLTTRLYTWDDVSTDLNSAFKVWRSANDESERSVEIEYGYDGRMRAATARHIEQAEPEITGRYLWGPLDPDFAMGTTELQPDNVVRSSRAVLDIGSLHTRASIVGAELFLDHPIVSADGASLALGVMGLDRSPQPIEPFRIGWGVDSAGFSSPKGVEQFATALASSNVSISQALQKEALPEVTLRWIGEQMPAPRTDFIDDWSGEPLARRGLAGARFRRSTNDQLANDITPAGGLWNPCSGASVTCGQPIGQTVSADPCATPDSVKEIEIYSESGGRHFPGPPVHCSEGFKRWLYGGDSCEYEYKYARSTGQPESYQYPDITATGVSLKNGDFIEEVTDLAVFDAAGDVPFTRTYRSGFSGSGVLGPKWRHNWEESLDFGRDPELGDTMCGYFVRWIQADGSAMDFFWHQVGATGVWSVPADSNVKLKVTPSTGTPTQYDIRTSDGTVRTFNAQGELTALQRRSVKYELERQTGTGRLLSISTKYVSGDGSETTGVKKLNFTYYASGKLQKVYNQIAQTTHCVTFNYNPECGELMSATYPAVTLGYSNSGANISTSYTPMTTYTYANTDLACGTGKGAGYHMLATIDRSQYNPLTSTSSSVRVLSNLYGTSPLGAASMTSNRVTTQCFGTMSCDISSGTRRIDYEYIPSAQQLEPGEQWIGFPFDSIIHDRRGAQDVRERHHYYYDKLKWIDEDVTGINRRTSFDYNSDDLLERTTFPDGSCEVKTYESAGTGLGTYKLVGSRTLKSREACNGDPGAAPGRTTKYTYEWLTGQVLTETGPEAFRSTGGVVPGSFSPNSDDYRGFTRFYYYDVQQSTTTYPQLISDACATWSIPCPAMLGDLNTDNDPLTSDDADDNVYWSGALVKTRVVPRDPDGTFLPELVTKQTVSKVGRPIKQTGPDGVSTTNAYYSSATSWSLGNGTSSAGVGPLASSAEKAIAGSTHPALTTKVAYNTRGEVTVTELPSCERIENRLNGGGLVTEQARTAPSAAFTTCPTSGTWTALTRTRSTFDLLGRPIQTLVVEASTNIATPSPTAIWAFSWSTYDTLGRLKSVTLNPQTTVVPGQSPTPAPGDSTTHLLSLICHDGYGRPTRKISPEKRVSCTNYDSLGRAIEIISYAALAGTGSPAGDDSCAGTSSETGQILIEDACPVTGTADVVAGINYDIVDQPFRSTDPNGTNTYRWYDQQGNLQFVSDGRPAGARLPLGLGSLPSDAVAAKWFSDSTFDLAGRATRTRIYGRKLRPSGQSGWLRSAWTTYDSLGRPRTSKVALEPGVFVPAAVADSTAPEDDPNGTRIAVTQTKYRDADGKIEKTINPENLIVTYEYDDLGRAYRSRLPLFGPGQDQVEQSFDDYGRLYRTTRTSYHTSVPSGFQETIQRAFDVWGRVIRTTEDPGSPSSENLITTYEYDALSREVRRITRWVDAPSYSGWDANDRVSETRYDLAGRTDRTRQRTKASPEAWAETLYGYSRDGLMVSLTDAEASVTTWDYASVTPGLARVGKMLYPVVGGKQQNIVISYDKNGNPIEFLHRAANSGSPETVKWTNTYDDDLLVQRSAVALNVTPTPFLGTDLQLFEHDDLGRIVRATDHSPATIGPDIVVENVFDTGGRLIREDQQVDPTGTLVSRKVDSTYRRDGFRTSLTFPDNGVPSRYNLGMAADALGRLAAVTEPISGIQPPTQNGRELLRYEYLGSKPWLRHSGNGLEARYFDSTIAPLYNHLGRSLGVRYVDEQGTSPDPAEFRYGYDRVGNRLYEQRRHESLANPANSYRTRTFKTDMVGRLERWREQPLTNAQLPLRTAVDPTNNPAISSTDGEDWSLDKVGNWSSHSTGSSENPPTDTFVPNDLNQYTQVSTGGTVKPFTFDWLGQLVQDSSKGTDGQQYKWDLFGRLTRVAHASNDAEIAKYRYDAFNRRVQRTSSYFPDLTTRFVYDGWRSIEERAVVGSGEQVRARYGFGNSLDEVVWMDRASQGGSNPPIDKRYFFSQDGLGSVVAATQDRTTVGSPLIVAERYTYDAYGDRSVWTGTWTSGSYTAAPNNLSLVGMPFGFTGQRFDPESGLYYFKNRSFDPTAGRFLRRDLVGYSDGPHLYQYADSSPSAFIDPLGLASTASITQQNEQLNRSAKAIAGGPGYCLCNYSAAPGGARTDLQRWRVEMGASSLGGDTGPGGRNLVVDDGSHMASAFEMEAMGATFNVELGVWMLNGVPITNVDISQFSGITLSDVGGALFRNVVYDYKDPLFGSHVAEAATLIPFGKLGKLFKWGERAAKWGRRLFRAEEAAEAARDVERLVVDANKLNHIFGKAEHNLGPLVEALGSEATAFTAVEDATQAAVKSGGLTGVFETTVRVAGQDVVVTGKVIDGTARIGTFFIPPVP